MIDENKLQSFFDKKNVLVIGGLGFIGSTVALRLSKYNCNITVVDSMIPEYGGNLFNIEPVKNNIRINISDIRDQYSLKYLVQNQDIIFNLAGQVSHIDSMTDPFTDLEINCKSQLAFLEVCRHENSDAVIVFSSTRQIYGKPQYLPVNESHRLNPSDVNGINKIAGEMYHSLYHKVYDLKTISLRLTNTYGPRQLLKHNKHGFTGWFVRLILENKKISIFGTGEQLRDFNYVDDVVDAMFLSAANPDAYGKIYNLGSPEKISLKTFVETLIETNGAGEFEIIPFPPEKAKIDIGDYYADFSLIKKELGWTPKTSLKKGLELTLEYYKKYKQHYF